MKSWRFRMDRAGGEIPEDLKALLETSYQAVLADPHHDLTLGRRIRILLAMGDYTDGLVIGSPGHRRRTTLGILATRKVLPIWHQYWPDDYLPDFMLLRSEEVLDRPITAEERQDLIHGGQRHIEDIAHQENLIRRRDSPSWDENGLLQWKRRMNGLSTGGAAVFTFCTAMFDEEVLVGGPYDLELADSNMDWNETDPSFFAEGARHITWPTSRSPPRTRPPGRRGPAIPLLPIRTCIPAVR